MLHVEVRFGWLAFLLHQEQEAETVTVAIYKRQPSAVYLWAAWKHAFFGGIL